MREKLQKKREKIATGTSIGIFLLVLITIGIGVLGYKVILQAGEVPGKLSSLPIAASNLNYYNRTVCRVQKVDYDTMKYGYMEGMLLAQMDYMDRYYESERMDEIRAVKNLTAMSEHTSDKIAYEKAKKEQEAIAEQKRQAAALAEQLKKQRELAAQQGYNTYSGVDTGSGDTAARGGQVGEPVFATEKGKSLGKFTITAYCTCRICCGVYSGNNRTASGTVPTSNRTIAVDTNVIPFGTKVIINGQVYVAEDRGGAIKGKRIDMFFMTHKEALRWGRRSFEVYLAK